MLLRQLHLNRHLMEPRGDCAWLVKRKSVQNQTATFLSVPSQQRNFRTITFPMTRTSYVGRRTVGAKVDSFFTYNVSRGPNPPFNGNVATVTLYRWRQTSWQRFTSRPPSEVSWSACRSWTRRGRSPAGQESVSCQFLHSFSWPTMVNVHQLQSPKWCMNQSRLSSTFIIHFLEILFCFHLV